MSFAPRDSHEAQVQFALERGVPAVIGVLGTIKLPYPSRAFDMAHCSRCLIPWGANDGMYMMEVDRVLRPGGYWVLSGPPINWRTNYQSWQRPKEELEEEQRKIEEIAKLLCWEKKHENGEISIWRKRINKEYCHERDSHITMCESTNADDVWYKKMGACVTPYPETTNSDEVAGGELLPFPERLNAVPPRISSGSIPGISVELFQADNNLWKKHMKVYKTINNIIDSGRYRNIMDMNAGLGSFAAALESPKLWVMNVMPTIAEKDTLGVIYQRGLIGIYHDWCEAFSTYPRTYDLIHANGVFSLYEDKCNAEDILLEMDRILRPEGSVIFRDQVNVLIKVKRIVAGMRWNTKMVDHEDGPLVPEKILVAVKQYWVAVPTSLYSMESEGNISHLRVASFSAYLNTAEDNCVVKLAATIQDSSPAIISAEETLCPITVGRIKTKEGEINVFEADKYFNVKMDYENPGLADNARKHGNKKEDQADLHPHLKPKFRHGTPSNISEESWNTQTALLPRLMRNSSQNKQKRAIGKRFFLGFICSGSCFDKKSVYIDGSVAHGMVQEKEGRNESIQIVNPATFEGTKQSKPGLERGEHFDCPILNSGMENLTAEKKLEEEKVEEEPRKSLEVFGSHMVKKDDIAMNLERKLSMLTWDAIPEALNPPTTLGSGGDDIESDASSDLFEIENISGTGQYSLLTRKASDNMSSCMTPTTQYAPSEASIEWSVVTASAADLSAVADYDEKNIVNAKDKISSSTTSKTAKAKNIAGKTQKIRPSGMLGCRSHKAVNVAETAYRTNEKAKSTFQ
ncbi:hypothetical protein F0562_023445 [Nyssa sinensis]|uniref:Methyltransferase n=1 Tax=Nyssa sinensis TaxID=561372 RepID=A0A5J5BI38_9ASTE|nr:hypothetical protein F0562_023445 [Nyssa sinensis]